MEEAVEQNFLQDGKDADSLDAELSRLFPKIRQERSKMSAVAFWRASVEAVESEPGDFVLAPPWTRAQASAFYRHLCQPDHLRRNKDRPEQAVDPAPVRTRC